MFCPYCGTNVSEEYSFCPKCGKKLPGYEVARIAEPETSINKESLKVSDVEEDSPHKSAAPQSEGNDRHVNFRAIGINLLEIFLLAISIVVVLAVWYFFDGLFVPSKNLEGYAIGLLIYSILMPPAICFPIIGIGGSYWGMKGSDIISLLWCLWPMATVNQLVNRAYLDLFVLHQTARSSAQSSEEEIMCLFCAAIIIAFCWAIGFAFKYESQHRHPALKALRLVMLAIAGLTMISAIMRIWQ